MSSRRIRTCAIEHAVHTCGMSRRVLRKTTKLLSVLSEKSRSPVLPGLFPMFLLLLYGPLVLLEFASTVASLMITSSEVVLDLMILLVTELRRHFKNVVRTDPCLTYQEVRRAKAAEAAEAAKVTEVAKAAEGNVVVVVVVEVDILRFIHTRLAKLPLLQRQKKKLRSTLIVCLNFRIKQTKRL